MIYNDYLNPVEIKFQILISSLYLSLICKIVGCNREMGIFWLIEPTSACFCDYGLLTKCVAQSLILSDDDIDKVLEKKMNLDNNELLKQKFFNAKRNNNNKLLL